MPYPAGMTDGESRTTARFFEFWCDRVIVPGAAFKTQPFMRYGYGPTEDRPVNVNFRSGTLDVLNDGLNYNLRFFRRWMNLIQPFDFSQGMQPNTYTFKYRNQYTTEMIIRTYNEHAEQISEIVLRDAYPTSLDPLAMNWADNNSLQRISVTMTFTDWYEVNPTNEPA